MRRTTALSRGEVVLVEFIFSNESKSKLRPAAIVSSSAYHRARQEIVIAAVTSNVTRQLVGDHIVADWRGAGLLFPAVVTGIIRTVKRSMIRRKLGSLAQPDLDAVSGALRDSLGL